MILIALIVLNCVALYQLFEKAGESGWKALIPFYNRYIYCKISDCENLFIAELVLGFSSFSIALWKNFRFFLRLIQGILAGENIWSILEPKEDMFSVIIVLVVFMILLTITTAVIEMKFVSCYTDETEFKLLAVVGSVKLLRVFVIFVRVILGFGKKYKYQDPRNIVRNFS